MRRGLGLVVAVSILASSPGSAAAPRFPTGWWQSTEVDALDGQATSFELRRTGRGRYVVRHLLTWGSNCGSGDFGDEDPRIAVDRNGCERPACGVLRAGPGTLHLQPSCAGPVSRSLLGRKRQQRPGRDSGGLDRRRRNGEAALVPRRPAG